MLVIIHLQAIPNIHPSVELQSLDNPREDCQGIQIIDLTHFHCGKVTITLDRR